VTEVDVVVTDYLLALESLYFGLYVYFSKRPMSVRLPYLILFTGFVGATGVGGTVHGFFNDPSLPYHGVLWWITLLCTGITGFGFALCGTDLIFAKAKRRQIYIFLATLLAIYFVVSLFYRAFLLGILFFVPATTLALIGLIVRFRKTAQARIKIAGFGLGLLLVAPIVQQLKISVHPTYLSHNAFYHVIIMVAIAMFFVGVKRIISDSVE